jgi:succinate dehydrogenase / fumarate reductase iron-sulfur subunit
MNSLRLLFYVVPEVLRNSDRYLGPAALLKPIGWVQDSRDEATGDRLDNLEDPFRLYRCHRS